MNYSSDRYTGPSEAWHTSENKLLIPHRSALFKPQARTTEGDVLGSRRLWYLPKMFLGKYRKGRAKDGNHR